MRLTIFIVPVFALMIGCDAPPTSQPASEQIIEVRGEIDSFRAKLVCFERRGRSWERAFECPATVGKNGIIRSDYKKEGDGKTPGGIFKLERAFGYAPTLTTGLEYSPVTVEDIWIDDPESPDYNRRVKKPTTAKSFEELRRTDDLYEVAAIIEYNTKSIQKGAGSAIFLHVWGGPERPTDGCVAIERDKLITILKWLDAKKKPQIIIGLEGSASMMGP